MKMLGGVSLVGNKVRMAKRGVRFEFADLGDLKQQMERNAEIMRGNMENFRRASTVVRTAQLLALLAVSDAGERSQESGVRSQNAGASSSSLSESAPAFYLLTPDACILPSCLSIFGIGGVGCRIENANYWRDYAQNGRVMGRSSLFVSTLNSTPLCEAAITIGAQGSIRYVDNSSEVESFLHFYPDALVLAMRIFEDRAAAGVFCRGIGNRLEGLLE